MPTFQFDTFELRPRTRELYRAGIRVKLRPQSFQVLLVLLESAGKVVSREEFHKNLWPSDTFVDFEHGLNTSVRDLRAVLGDSVQETRFIETLPKLGYRFIAPVSLIDETTPSPPRAMPAPSTEADSTRNTLSGMPASHPVAISAPAEQASGRSTRRWLLIAAACVVAIAAIVMARYRSRPSSLGFTPPGRIMVAVVPFENLNGDQSQEYLSDGLTEEIISRLNRIDPKQIGVIARTSVMRYKPGGESTETAGRQLGVQYLLKGAFRRDAEKITVTTKLIRAADQAQLWTHEYNRMAPNLRDIQEEIAEETCDAIFLALGEQRRIEPIHPGTSRTKNESDAFLHYLKGRYFWNKRNEQGFGLAIREFQSAIDKEPTYAQAYAGLADSYNLSSSYGLLPTKVYMPKAREAALRALQLDESLAEAHASLASVAQNLDWDWPTAEREYRRAIELNPNYATAHHWYAECLALQGRFNEAFMEIAKARELDPLSLIIGADYGAILYFSRNYGQAIQQFHTVLEMDPDFPRAHMISYAYVEEGRFPEALGVVEKWQSDGHTTWAWPIMAYIYGRWGKKTEAEHAIQKMIKSNRRAKMDPSTFVVSNLGLGNKKVAMDWLEKAFAERSPFITAMKVDPIYEPLYTEARFHSILKQMNLEK
jgi:TolB-like protein/DNA-binding winged helix-turn-helix (wHTH) protein/lipoprotein NlpI